MNHSHDYGRRAHERLDEWSRGFMTGVIAGAVLTLGMIWIVTEPLR